MKPLLIALAIFCVQHNALANNENESVDADSNVQTEELANKFLNEKLKMLSVDEKSREIMSSLYQINLRMKHMSKKRDILSNKYIDSEGNVRNLAKNIVKIEDKIKEQRHRLAKRMRAIYMFGEEGVARVVFSSASTQDLDQSLKYLKLISDHDYALIKSFERNLKIYKIKREKLNATVRQLAKIKIDLKNEEQRLANDQNQKADILNNLKSAREKSLSKIQIIRKAVAGTELQSLLSLGFFEQKGILRKPVTGKVEYDYGLVENERFRYRLSHKGQLYATSTGTDIAAVYDGKVSFVGEIDGYGQSLIIDHGDHYYSVYAMARNILVSEGQSVKKNDILAKAENKLYFEIRHFSDAIDPRPWFKRL
jgi:murein hydrolase activator